jgi:hypothetical protein
MNKNFEKLLSFNDYLSIYALSAFSAIPSPFPGATGNPAPMFHCKQYSQSEFIELLTSCGFRLLEFRRIGTESKQMLAICTSRAE